MLGPHDLSGPAIRWEGSADSFTHAGYVVRGDSQQIRIDCSRCDGFHLLQHGLAAGLLGENRPANVLLATYPLGEDCPCETADQYSFSGIPLERLMHLVGAHRSVLFETGYLSMSIAGHDGGSVVFPTHGTVVVNYPQDSEAVSDLECFLAFNGFFPKLSSISDTYRDIPHAHVMRTDFSFRLNRLLQDLAD